MAPDRRHPSVKPLPQHLPFLTLILLLLMTFYAFHGPVRAWLSGRYRAKATFGQALDLVLDEYVDPRQPGDLAHEGIRGLVRSLKDKHSAFLSPARNQEQREAEAGRYAGLGITIRLYQHRALIQKVFQGSPAEQAGLKPGDFILAADGADLSHVETLQKVSDALRGREGSTAHLVLERGAEQIEVDVTRAVVRPPVVEHTLLAPGLGYVRVADFPDQVTRHLTAALAELREKAPALRGLILDVRWNQGGFLDEAVRVADLFIADGVIVRTRSRHPSDDRAYRAEPGGAAEGISMVVLVNASSASAAEVVAGALQDHGRAQLVGTTTYGKGAVNKRFSLPDGSGLLITTGKYYLPKGRQIEGKGLKPDLEVPPPTPEQINRAPPGAQPPDPQRDAALRLLRRQLGEL